MGFKPLVCAVVLLPLAGVASAQTLLTNGGFETGDFSGWTLVGDPDNSAVVDFSPSEGDYAAFLGEIGGIGSLTQSLATTAGQSYRIEFDLAGGEQENSQFAAFFGGAQLLSIVNPGFDTDYTRYGFTTTATGLATDLRFEFREDAFFYILDGVSVTPVPEPATMAALGLGAAAFLRRRRRR